MSRSQTKRKTHSRDLRGVWGDETVKYVAEGNNYAIQVAFMCSLGWVNDINYIIEQPLSSVLGSFPCMEALFDRTAATRTTTYLGCFGAPSMKAVKMWHTAAWVGSLRMSKPRSANFIRLVRRSANG